MSRTINDEILDIVSYEIKNIAFPSECIITKIYDDNYVDIESSVYGSLTYVKIFGEYDINEKGILLFLNNELSSPIVVGGADSDISDLIDLVNEVKEELMNKVDKISGKGLSSNDFTDSLKSKLDGIESGANKITVDSSLSNSSSNPLQNNAINSALNNKVDKVSGKGLSTNDFTTALLNKLNAIEAEANKTIIDSALSSTSTNPLQNKIINSLLSGKSDSGHTHSYLELTGAIPANSDLDDYTSPGNYGCTGTNSGTLANKPFIGNYPFILENKKYNSNSTAVGQFVYMLTSAKAIMAVYYRGYVSNSWTDWLLMAGTGRVPSNSDLNDFILPGDYLCWTSTNARTVDNTPWGDKSSNALAFNLIVKYTAYASPNFGYTQIIYPYSINNAGTIFKRNCYNNSWSPWYKLEMTAI